MSIYKVFFRGYDECYIGSTRGSLSSRLDHHIAQTRTFRNTHSTCDSLIIKYGSINADIVLVESGEWTDQELLDKERHYILNTPGVVNKNLPQPKETSQVTDEGKKAYMEIYRQKNAEVLKQKEKEYKSKPEIKERNIELGKIWKEENAEKIKANKQTVIECTKCHELITKSNKWRHDKTCEENMKKKTERRADYDMLIELRKEMSLRAIVDHEYFKSREGYKNHQSLQKLQSDFEK